ncbi:MAG: HD-GYP domain-containing protein [Rhodospirillaceae bacterium]
MSTSVYKSMIIWLGAAALLISAALAAATMVFELERVDDAIVNLAVGEAKTFYTLHQDIFRTRLVDSQDLPADEQLKRFLTTRASNAEGHFILAELYHTDYTLIGMAVNDMEAGTEQALSAHEHGFPTGDLPLYDKILHDGRLYIRVVVLLRSLSDARPLGYFEGVYHVSDERTATIEGRMITNVLLVIAVVFCTTLFLVPVVLRVNREQYALSRQLMRANLETLEVLGSAIAKRDSDTGAHNYRVAIFAIRLAEAVGLPANLMRELIKGAFLHDVGKIGVSDTILLKPARLTVEEFNDMKQHVAHGVDIIRSASWLKEAADVVLYHHEKFDGSGYLKGLKGKDIPLIARIFAIADVFDALIVSRPYKEPMSFERALSIIEEGAGLHFDPDLTVVFCSIARPLYDAYANGTDDTAELCLKELTGRYFRVGKA